MESGFCYQNMSKNPDLPLLPKGIICAVTTWNLDRYLRQVVQVRLGQVFLLSFLGINAAASLKYFTC